MHNHDVATAKAAYASVKAHVKGMQSMKTLSAAKEVARGFEEQVALMNKEINERLEAMNRVDREEKER